MTIKIKNLKKSFGKIKVLDGVNYDIAEGASLAIIGPSGCGKSTLLKLLIGLDNPTAGSICIDEMDVAALSDDGLILLRKKIGMVFQTSALFDSLSVFENVAFSLREHSTLSEREIRRIVKGKLEMVDLAGTETLMPAELSGGMQKRVSIARALASDPKIILYDEPTTGLDPITSVTIENLMLKLSRELKVTSIIVTHVLQTVDRVARQVVMLHKGQFIETGSPEQTRKSQNEVVRQFITGGS
ncbi:ABC transporter ATP-binding protein [candidate division WOR-1 bacterium RIFCSPLOWO2_02_FULL_46_20]|uniref:ABC transporter ATP-binding protein n=2 Tax=Saganbacteria TaxID=1703751 RepID=A0A1F4RD55_UNCSA|nr:MAG: ABC transporter ATP-binding protein [candidate division WOR-1 bacterium RIFCSPHIGHO2_02_FULL_45_12]OGC06112.1 MAG: ABC transporter ATP-binding protein [candidate division WOR-1 bacterium RIFCSPLOWO2_02_FULL_46_20]OGC09386.1 MAG: ABC transporter ATP-binding protein [candidate division WOR-1 bacterium RIFCSPLOWO2_12_FULL_45_9]